MADTKITALTELASAYATGDLLCLVDVSDTTMDAAGTNKKTTLANLLGNLPGTPIGLAAQTYLNSDGANILALRNSTNAQAFRVYNTYTDASNNEYGAFAWAANVLQVGSVATGSGSNRDTELIASSGTVRLGSGVMFQPMTNYKIGNSGGIMAFQFVGSTSGAWNGGQFYGFNGFVAAKTSSETLTLYNERGLSTVITNEGATSKPTLSLTGASAGLFYEFAVQDADGLRIKAATGDTIRVTDSVTASGGYIESTTIGSVVRLFALNTTEWVATSIHGVWTDGTFTYDDTGLTT